MSSGILENSLRMQRSAHALSSADPSSSRGAHRRWARIPPDGCGTAVCLKNYGSARHGTLGASCSRHRHGGPQLACRPIARTFPASYAAQRSRGMSLPVRGAPDNRRVPVYCIQRAHTACGKEFCAATSYDWCHQPQAGAHFSSASANTRVWSVLVWHRFTRQ